MMIDLLKESGLIETFETKFGLKHDQVNWWYYFSPTNAFLCTDDTYHLYETRTPHLPRIYSWDSIVQDILIELRD